MYRLFYDEMTNKAFIADDTVIKTNLTLLQVRLLIPGGSFTFKEYLEALGLKVTIPRYKNYRFTRKDFDYPYVFEECLALRENVPCMTIAISHELPFI